MTPRTRNEDYDRARAVIIATAPMYEDLPVALTVEICKLMADARGEGYDEQAKITNEIRVRLVNAREEMLQQRERAEVAEIKAATINEQEVRIQRLVEVLRYYANYGIYQPHVADEGFVYVEPLICREDAGQKARDAIKEIAGV